MSFFDVKDELNCINISLLSENQIISWRKIGILYRTILSKKFQIKFLKHLKCVFPLKLC